MKLLEIIGIVIIMFGIILIYDARYLSKKRFSFSDQNIATLTLKIVGFIISVIGGFLIMISWKDYGEQAWITMNCQI